MDAPGDWDVMDGKMENGAARDDDGMPAAAKVLYAGAAAFGVLGVSVAVWLFDKALRFPQIRAEQAGNTAPLWIPFALFVLVGTGLGAYVLVAGARRVRAGEDLFAQRHRRRPGTREQDDGA